VNSLLDETDDREDRSSRSANQGADREITLGTTMILLIFFALAVYGAVLFGFGYSLGSKHTESTAGTVAAVPTSSGNSNAFKPSPGSPVGAPSPEKPLPAMQTATVPVNLPVPEKADPPAPKAVATSQDFDDAALKSKGSQPVAAVTTSAMPASVAPGPGTVVVQVAAVSHQEDADLIASTLKRRGYAVNVRTEADKLLHVQVGPFATRKDAETMKAKLLSDGFNAYIK
jgi:DedD protein